MSIPRPSPAVHLEIYREFTAGLDDRYSSATWIAQQYGISTATAIRYRNEKPRQLASASCSTEEIIRYSEAGFEPEDIAKALSCTSARVRKALGIKRQIITDDIKLAVEEELAKGISQKTLALRYGISESSVSNINPCKTPKPKRQGLSDDNWESLKVSMSKYSMSELARLYNISRAYIYARLAKEKTN